jgi:thiol-disulfide isomerase/thioredoxin
MTRQRMRVRKGAWVVTACALAVAGCRSDRPPGPGDRLPDAALEVVDPTGTTWSPGDRLVLSDLRGRPAFLDFWASWCPPCREQHRNLTEIAQRYGDRIAVVGILVDDTPGNALRWLEAQGALYPTVREEKGVLAEAFWIPATGLPHMALLDAEGRLVWHQVGASAAGVPTAVLSQLDSILGVLEAESAR